MKPASIVFLFTLLAMPAFAQSWSTDFDGAAFLTNVSSVGPKNAPKETFSTNWLAASAEHPLGGRGRIAFRLRGSLEPLTIKEQGYPQLLQFVSRESGGPLVDRMRAQPLISEAAVRLQWAALHVDLAPVGDPPLGAAPYVLRSSSRDFAEAPFAYDVQESFHEATRVASAGLTTGFFSIDGGVFHHAISTGRHDHLDNGPIDSWSTRLTVTPVPNLALQVSHGALGRDKRKVSSASATYGGALAASAIWTRREMIETGTHSSLAFELVWRASRATLMARAEATDRPLTGSTSKRRTDVTFGAIVDVLRARAMRTGIGVNVDYHSQTRELQTTYGHKPQSVYLFVVVRGR